ncbi:MAG: saposin domain-containing protein [Candidatus Hodarchaeota archaeon]
MASLACEVCKHIVNQLEEFLTNNKNPTEDDLLNQILQGVSQLPLHIQSTAYDFIDEYGPGMVQWILDKEPISEFCAQIGLCDPE